MIDETRAARIARMISIAEQVGRLRLAAKPKSLGSSNFYLDSKGSDNWSPKALKDLAKQFFGKFFNEIGSLQNQPIDDAETLANRFSILTILSDYKGSVQASVITNKNPNGEVMLPDDPFGLVYLKDKYRNADTAGTLSNFPSIVLVWKFEAFDESRIVALKVVRGSSGLRFGDVRTDGTIPALPPPPQPASPPAPAATPAGAPSSDSPAPTSESRAPTNPSKPTPRKELEYEDYDWDTSNDAEIDGLINSIKNADVSEKPNKSCFKEFADALIRLQKKAFDLDGIPFAFWEDFRNAVDYVVEGKPYIREVRNTRIPKQPQRKALAWETKWGWDEDMSRVILFIEVLSNRRWTFEASLID